MVMATPSSNNPGFYEVTAQRSVPGTYDPATGFISGGGTVTEVQTYADDGTLAYTQTVGPDGKRGEPSYSPAYSKNNQDVPSPSGPLYRNDLGHVVDADPAHAKIDHATPGDALAIVKNDPGYAARQFKNGFLDNLDPAHAAGNLSGFKPGQAIDTYIDNTFQNGVSKISGVPTTNGDGSPVGPAATSGATPPGSGDGSAPAGGGINTDAISAAAAASRAMSDKFLAEYNASHPNQPPTMTAAQLPPAAQADMVAQIQAAQAAGIDPIKAAQADRLDPFSASHATATLLDPTQQAEQRGRQVSLEDDLGNVIAGKGGPSVAELELRAAEQRQEANQLGLASKASGGGNVALAGRTAANNIGRLNQASSADAALLRAQEIDAARARLGGVIDQTRGSDITLAGHNADLSTDISKTNANLDTSATLKSAELEAARRASNAGLTTSASLKDADLEAARRASNATLTTSTAIKDAELEAARRAANASQTNATSIAQGGFNNTASANNLTAALEQQRIDAAAKDAAAKNALSAGGQVITGTVGAAQAQAQAVAAAQAAKNAKDAKEAAWIGAISTGVAALA
jgi:hypothetical protein